MKMSTDVLASPDVPRVGYTNRKRIYRGWVVTERSMQ